ncbi:PTS sugar transporter subunit IIC [Clostridium vincentii]|uniref:Permease IIC component n=1 Tax=Clostridium vincentii TaxID=52704 RepID=A0A2T0BGN7_9CLOT|nr:PTS sugar transporter subunit IIC [Clostridium vincentii]PRR83003.1 Lichenan permease IIC component [Clostridium vincentii]
MSSLGKFFDEKVLPLVMKFVTLKGVVALKDGIMSTLPLTIVGSLFLLIAQFPIPAVNDWMASVFGGNWSEPLWQTFGATFGIMALVASIGIAYIYVKNEGYEPLPAGIISLVVFIITIDGFVKIESGEKVGNVIPKTWTGGQGMITAIIIGIIVGAIYSWFMKHKITIKMPDAVPSGVANSFTALIPAAAIITGATAIYIFFRYGLNTTFVEWIYKVIQTPLQGMTDSLGGVIVISFLIPFLWWFGVHGAAIVGGVMGPILTSNTLENQAILTSGKALTLENGAHIVTQQFLDLFINLTGSGITFAFVLCMIIIAKSTQFKQLGKLAVLPGVFNINEPVTFGAPIVMNPFMAVPFIITPVISGIIAYFAIAMGLVEPFAGVILPWTTPAIISGFIIGGWKTALLQIVILIIAFFIYLPFFKKQDNLNFKNEQDSEDVQA